MICCGGTAHNSGNNGAPFVDMAQVKLWKRQLWSLNTFAHGLVLRLRARELIVC
jgi:hypothetical protein